MGLGGLTNRSHVIYSDQDRNNTVQSLQFKYNGQVVMGTGDEGIHPKAQLWVHILKKTGYIIY